MWCSCRTLETAAFCRVHELQRVGVKGLGRKGFAVTYISVWLEERVRVLDSGFRGQAPGFEV